MFPSKKTKKNSIEKNGNFHYVGVIEDKNEHYDQIKNLRLVLFVKPFRQTEASFDLTKERKRGL